MSLSFPLWMHLCSSLLPYITYKAIATAKPPPYASLVGVRVRRECWGASEGQRTLRNGAPWHCTTWTKPECENQFLDNTGNITSNWQPYWFKKDNFEKSFSNENRWRRGQKGPGHLQDETGGAPKTKEQEWRVVKRLQHSVVRKEAHRFWKRRVSKWKWWNALLLGFWCLLIKRNACMEFTNFPVVWPSTLVTYI